VPINGAKHKHEEESKMSTQEKNDMAERRYRPDVVKNAVSAGEQKDLLTVKEYARYLRAGKYLGFNRRKVPEWLTRQQD
jgi:hypothetical protein